jgi:DNA mismatch repair protein MutS
MQVLVEQWRDTLVFLHRIAPGAADKSFGVHVARMAGVPDSVIGRAQELLAKLEGDSLTITRKTSKLPSLKGSEDAAYSASGRDDELPLFSKQR